MYTYIVPAVYYEPIPLAENASVIAILHWSIYTKMPTIMNRHEYMDYYILAMSGIPSLFFWLHIQYTYCMWVYTLYMYIQDQRNITTHILVHVHYIPTLTLSVHFLYWLAFLATVPEYCPSYLSQRTQAV